MQATKRNKSEKFFGLHTTPIESPVRCREAKAGKQEEKGWVIWASGVGKVGTNQVTTIQQKQFDADPREDLIINCVSQDPFSELLCTAQYCQQEAFRVFLKWN